MRILARMSPCCRQKDVEVHLRLFSSQFVVKDEICCSGYMLMTHDMLKTLSTFMSSI